MANIEGRLQELGVHARSVLGAVSLRAGLPLIIEAVFEPVAS